MVEASWPVFKMLLDNLYRTEDQLNQIPAGSLNAAFRQLQDQQRSGFASDRGKYYLRHALGLIFSD